MQLSLLPEWLMHRTPPGPSSRASVAAVATGTGDDPAGVRCSVAAVATGTGDDPAGGRQFGAVAERLYALGLPRETAVTLTRNRTVMISWRARSGLRMHAGYAAAPDHVFAAIVRFLARRVPRTERLAARRVFMAFPVEQHAPSRPERVRVPRAVPPGDRRFVERLTAAHAEMNTRHFDGALPVIPVRLSHRMHRRLGELRAPRDGLAFEIIISHRHVRRDRWDMVLDTLLHEMVHQWQAVQGHRLDHGRTFRRKAKEVGISPRAVADL